MNSQKAMFAIFAMVLAIASPAAVFAQTASTQKVEEKKPESIVFSRILKQGMYGKDVYSLQVILTDIGFYSGFNTGIFGPKTTTSIISFKKKNNLPANGIVDQATIIALDGVSKADISFEAPAEKKTKTTIATTTEVKPEARMAKVVPSTTSATTNVVSNMTASVATNIAVQDTALTTIATDSLDAALTTEVSTESPDYECFVSAVDPIIECNNAITAVEYSVKPQNKKAVIKILGAQLSANSVISIKPIIEGRSSKWMLNVGNSKFNDGWGGGIPQDPYNAEFQIVDGILGVFKGDNDTKVVSGAKTLFARDISSSLEESEIKVSQGQLELITANPLEKPVIIKDKNLFVFEGADLSKKDIYIGLNRTIFDGDRNGSGLKGVMITISPNKTQESVN